MGDFNTCLLKGDYRCEKLKSLTEACNLHILPLSATHKIPECTPSLLDLIIVSSPDFVLKHGQHDADLFSHHDLLFLTYKVRPPKAKSRILLRRNFGGMDKERLLEDASRMDWSAVENASTVDLKVELFNSFLIQLYDIHAPVKPIKMKHLPAPWLTDSLKKLIIKKGFANSKLKADKNEKNLRYYNKVRNRCNTLCRDAQRRHIHKSVENGDAAKVWKFLQSLGVGKHPIILLIIMLMLNSLTNISPVLAH
ncbi:unnamed protein product [Parnassius apollo]|uniref:(apollo) hypothetical protein n=1 Tax=Parnassius apollo TaxID=110799 RepID=A0A8S3XTZ0_PARAO|nr:unnamed protein product [Parnassius apollo]